MQFAAGGTPCIAVITVEREFGSGAAEIARELLTAWTGNSGTTP